MVNQEDLRLNQPFKELEIFACDSDQFNLMTMSNIASDDKDASPEAVQAFFD